MLDVETLIKEFIRTRLRSFETDTEPDGRTVSAVANKDKNMARTAREDQVRAWLPHAAAMKIYIASALTHVPRGEFTDYAKFLHRLAGALRAQPLGHDVKYALANSDPQLAPKPFGERARLCYLWDRGMVEEAELVIAEASFPSTGLGIELQVAETRDIPLLLCFRRIERHRVDPVEYVNPDQSKHELQIGEGFVSLMALGLPTVFRVIGYTDDDDGIRQILEATEIILRGS